MRGCVTGGAVGGTVVTTIAHTSEILSNIAVKLVTAVGGVGGCRDAVRDRRRSLGLAA